MIGFRQPRGRQVRNGVRAAAGSWESLAAAVMSAVEAARRRVDEGARDAPERADNPLRRPTHRAQAPRPGRHRHDWGRYAELFE
jgi:hypothetical protein